HAGADWQLADQVRSWLAGDGHEVFLDSDLHVGIAVGEQWRPRLFERLRWADAVVCLVTPAYLDSTWCVAEVAVASAQGSRLLPLRATPELTHPLLTEAVQYADLHDPRGARARLKGALARLD